MVSEKVSEARGKRKVIKTEMNYEKITKKFDIPGKLKKAAPFGNGHINDTIQLVFEADGSEKKYVLQKINKYVFKHPDELMANMRGVTDFLKKKIALEGGDPERETLTIIPARDGLDYVIDEDGEYWRVTAFVEGTVSYEVSETPEDFYLTGTAFGHFQSLLSDYPAETLYETIPGFHNTRARFMNFLKVVEEDKAGRVGECREEIEFILSRKDLACFFMESYEKGEIPLRVTHNDTKINNLLFDTKERKPVCVVDLDTVMPGFAMTDFGDAIRTGASTAMEDEPDVNKVKCDLHLYEEFAKGFIRGCGGKLTEKEIETLPMGALGITYEQALRFLADYLEGDVYYKTAYPEHNLVRTHTQMKLVREMEKNADKIREIIAKASLYACTT